MMLFRRGLSTRAFASNFGLSHQDLAASLNEVMATDPEGLFLYLPKTQG